MLGFHLVRPLEGDWRDTLDAIARDRSWPTTHDTTRLGARVSALSAAYNDSARARAEVHQAGAARLGFSFARDVPKGAAAVRELVATGALRPRGEALRVLDLGAGLGAMTWGVARALEAHRGCSVDVDATWVDTDADALELGRAIVHARRPLGARLTVSRAFVGPIAALDRADPFDVVLLGNVLSELEVGRPDEDRAREHAALLVACLRERLAPGGALVVVEPALRDRTRHLHRVRDLVAKVARPFAPCLHDRPCPALASSSDWCHEDLRVDLPPWLVPVARAAGLRYEGLTFSYLVYVRGAPPLAMRIARRDGAAARVVSDLIRTKGKRELFTCGESSALGVDAGRRRLVRLDRDATASNRSFATLVRGEVVVVTPASALERARIDSAAAVARAEIVADPAVARSESR